MQPIKDHLTDCFWPALSAKSMINFCLDSKIYERERRTAFCHGLSDEEKNNTSDNFELHLQVGLGILRKIAVVLIGFFSPKTGLFYLLEPIIFQDCNFANCGAVKQEFPGSWKTNTRHNGLAANSEPKVETHELWC